MGCTFLTLQTYLWVLNEEEEFERAFKLGATGVMTDFPTRLEQFLKSHPEYKWKTEDIGTVESSEKRPLRDSQPH